MSDVALTMRGKAFLVHLLGSTFLACIALYLVFCVWYPRPLDGVTGVTEIFLILLLVDLTLGPLLTFVVFKPEKKTLYFDLSAIVLIQLIAFGYGIWSVAQARPAWIVFNADRFDLVQIPDIDNRRISDAQSQYQDVALFGPRWVSARPPSDFGERRQIIIEALMAGVDIAQRPNLYDSLEAATEKMRIKSKSLEELNEYNKADKVNQVLRQWPDADAWLPLKGRAGAVVVLINKSSARIVAVVDLKPWG